MSYKNNIKYLPQNITLFYRQLMQYWYETYNTPPLTKPEALKEKLWYNERILVDNKPVNNSLWQARGIHYLADFLDDQGQFLSIQELEKKYKFRINIMVYNSLRSAIPRTWKKIIRSNNTPYELPKEDNLKVQICNKTINIEKISCKQFYWNYISKKGVRPSAFSKWEEQYYYINFDWDHITRIPYKTARETSLQSLQYKIIHRYFPCAKNVGTWYANESKLCNVCGEEDTLEHYFFNCTDMQYFWNSFMNWWKSALGFHFQLHTLDVVLGIPNYNENTEIDILNYLILFAKKHISKCKQSSTNIFFYTYQVALKERLLIEKYILQLPGNTTGDKNKEKWDSIIDML